MEVFEQRFVRAMDAVGGRYELTALLQKRIRELVRGDRPLVEYEYDDYIDLALEEVLQGKIEMGPEIKDPEDDDIDFGSNDEFEIGEGGGEDPLGI